MSFGPTQRCPIATLIQFRRMATALATALETVYFHNQQTSETTLAVLISICRSYSREKKLQTIMYYRENSRNKYRTCQKFGIAKGCLYQWIEKHKQIFDGSKGSKRVEGGRRLFGPDVEEKFVAEFTELRTKGLKVKQYWFVLEQCS